MPQASEFYNAPNFASYLLNVVPSLVEGRSTKATAPGQVDDLEHGLLWPRLAHVHVDFGTKSYYSEVILEVHLERAGGAVTWHSVPAREHAGCKLSVCDRMPTRMY